MTNETEVLHQSRLFDGVNDDDIEALLSCLGAERKFYSKGEVIFAQGTTISDFAILLSGKVHLQSIDYWGRVDLLGVIGAGECFGEAYAAGFRTLNSAVAADDCFVLFLDAGKLMTACPSACPFHSRAMRNMMSILASRNRVLVEKAGILSRRTTREKVLSYLSKEAARQGSSSFRIPLDRQALADYLAVDRSALSLVLSKLKSEGIIDYDRNAFCLLK